MSERNELDTYRGKNEKIGDVCILENARVALVGRASEVLECARAFKRPRIQNDNVFKTTTYSKRPRIQDFHRLENARVALVGRASEVLECARAFKRRRIQNDDVQKRRRTTYSGFP